MLATFPERSFAQILGGICRCSPESGPNPLNSRKVGRIRAKLGPNLAQTLSKLGPMWAKFGSKSVNVESKSVDVGRCCPEIDQAWPRFDQIRPSAIRNRPMLAQDRPRCWSGSSTFGRNWPDVGQTQTGLGRIGAASARCVSDFGCKHPDCGRSRSVLGRKLSRLARSHPDWMRNSPSLVEVRLTLVEITPKVESDEISGGRGRPCDVTQARRMVRIGICRGFELTAAQGGGV